MTIDRRVELSEFQLVPGMQLTCHAVASDYRPQTGRSDPRVLTVITPDQLLERMAVRQSQILAELARVLQLQRDARSQVRTLEIRLHETAGLEQADIDRLQAAEFNQREVARSLTSRSDGLPMQVLGLLADLETNRVDNPDFQRRLEGLLAEFDRLQREHLPPIGTELTAAIKGSLVRLQSSPRPAGRDAESESHLARAGEHQQQVIAALEGLLAGMRQWDDYRRFHREVAQLLRDQEEVARNTAALGAQTVGRDLKELSPQESADLKILAEHQFELARRQTRLEQEMEQTAAALGQSEPLAAANLDRRRGGSPATGDCRRYVHRGESCPRQRLGPGPGRSAEDLAEPARGARHPGEQPPAGIGTPGQETRRGRQGPRRAPQAARGPPPQDRRNCGPVGRQGSQEREAKGRTSEAGPPAGRTSPADPTARPAAGTAVGRGSGQAADKAAGQMEQGRRAGDAGDGQGASRGAKEAEKALRMPRGSSARSVLKSRPNWPWNSRPSLQDTIKHLHRQEERIAAETREFADMERGGALNRTQVSSLLELAHQQDLLRDETGRVVQSLDAGQHLPRGPVGCRGRHGTGLRAASAAADRTHDPGRPSKPPSTG